MTLVEIRQKFIEISGRFDLVTDTTSWADNGADFFINAGQEWLDRIHDLPKAEGRVFRLTEAGDYGVTFQRCRAIKEVWCADTEKRWQLKPISMTELRKCYWNEPLSGITQSEPDVWCPAKLRKIPDRITLADLEAIVGYADVMVAEDYTYRGILFMPPADGVYQIEVFGQFYSPELTDDDHLSYWTEVHPLALVQAAMAMLEMSYRNTQGYRDAVGAANELVLGVGFDHIDEVSANVTRMEG